VKIPFSLTLLLIHFHSFSQNDLRQVNIGDLPEEIREIKYISKAVRWTDSLGDNVLLTTKKIVKQVEKKFLPKTSFDPLFKRVKSPYSTQKKYKTETFPPYAYHFLIKDDTAILTWKVAGSSKYCENEEGNHLRNWFVITDLNKDSKAEAWLIYKSPCISQKDSGSLEIVMYQNDFRSTLTGPLNSGILDDSFFNEGFRNGAAVFRNYAKKLWGDYVLR